MDIKTLLEQGHKIIKRKGWSKYINFNTFDIDKLSSDDLRAWDWECDITSENNITEQELINKYQNKYIRIFNVLMYVEEIKTIKTNIYFYGKKLVLSSDWKEHGDDFEYNIFNNNCSLLNTCGIIQDIKIIENPIQEIKNMLSDIQSAIIEDFIDMDTIMKDKPIFDNE